MNSLATVIYRSQSCIGLIGWHFGDYYLHFIPKYTRYNKQKHETHVTIVRNFENIDLSDKYLEGEKFEFNYSNDLKEDDKYFYLECWSPTIDKIRMHYGLDRHRMNNCHHITIGNKK